MEDNQMDKIIEIIKKAKRVVVLTGAGVSAESGISTFRDPDGLWNKFNPMELASVNGFMSNPELVWDWYNYRRNIIGNTTPNAGHYAIAEMQDLFENFTLITQNVDRLHQNAGSKNVLELHGNIIDNHCLNCEEKFEDAIDISNKNVPICKKCGGKIRPSVVWFGEMLPAETLKKSEKMSAKADVFFSIGTSGEVYPAAGLPAIAKQNGAFVIEINPNQTSISYFMHSHFRNNSAEVLPEIVRKLKGLMYR